MSTQSCNIEQTGTVIEVNPTSISKVELDNIPEICIDDTGSRSRVNFALRPRGINKITDLEIWEYNLKNEPIDMLIYVVVDDYWFNFLETNVFDEEIILDIYNYCV